MLKGGDAGGRVSVVISVGQVKNGGGGGGCWEVVLRC